jgi:hypothetical protein
MDPNACCRQLTAALRDGDLPEASTLAAHLSGWIARGGFAPREALVAEMLEAMSSQLGSLSDHIDQMDIELEELRDALSM